MNNDETLLRAFNFAKVVLWEGQVAIELDHETFSRIKTALENRLLTIIDVSMGYSMFTEHNKDWFRYNGTLYRRAKK